MIKTQWFLPNRIPIPAFGILQGEGGIGKTTVVFDLIARASRGGQLPDGSAGIGVLKTVLFATEDTTSRIGAQLKAAKADLTNIIFVPWVDTTEGRTSFTLPTHASALENIVVRTGARLVYIDSLFDTFAEGLDTNNARDVRSALGPLRDVAKNTGCVILATRHVTKAIGRASVRGMGSGDIGNLARFVFQVAPHPQDPTIKLLSEVKKNSGRPCDSLAFRIDDVELLLDEGQVEDVSVITWIGTDATTADEAALGLSSKRDQAKEKILEALRQGEVKSEELMKQIGCSRGTFFKAKADLISEGHNIHARKTGMSGGWLWKLLGGPAEESHA